MPQLSILIRNIKIGAKMNNKLLAKLGMMVSFDNNLNASANACNNPYSPTTLGPLLRCIPAKIFLSNTVKKATIKTIGNIIGNPFNQSKAKIATNTYKTIFFKNIINAKIN